MSLIHYFAALDYADAIEFIYSHGANVNLKAKDSNLTPLVIAAARGHDKTVRTLMNLGAEILQKLISPESESKKGNSSSRRRENDLSFPSLPNTSIIQRRNSGSSSGVSSD